MPASAVICELNPLHNGHLHVINKAKSVSMSPVILVMSGNFTQRAGVASFNKYARARAAVEAGADLCVELLFPYSSAGAEYFARAGVCIAEKLGAECLVFGSESGDRDYLRRVADALDSEEYKKLFADLAVADPTSGAAVIRERSLSELIHDYTGGNTPNDILAAEYIRAASIECVPIKRIDTPSASDLRVSTIDECAPFVPTSTMEMMRSERRADQGLFCDLLWKYLRLFAGDLSDIAECSGGLGNRLKNIARESTSADEFFTACRTKRYTNSRITRAALFAMGGVTQEDIVAPPAYTTLLAANSRGLSLLSDLRKSGNLPILTKPADFADLPTEAQRQFRLNAKMDELYALLIGERSGHFMTMSPYIEK